MGIYELSGETMELSIILDLHPRGLRNDCSGLSPSVLPNALRAANDVKFHDDRLHRKHGCWRVGFSYIIGVRMGMVCHRRLDRHGGGLGLPRDLLRDPLPQRSSGRKI